MDDVSRPTILCVDDEPHVLDGLGLHFRRRYDLLAATSGAEALERLRQAGDVAVVISDMCMPRMDGATFLSLARHVAPAAVRLLLTGQSDLHAAIAAVNEGQIFRFLTKPCPPSALLGAVDAAIEQNRLLTAVEEEMVTALPAVAERWPSNIPRLDEVRGILSSCGERSHVHGTRAAREGIGELPLSALRAGMILAEDVKLATGTLLAARGYEVTPTFVDRARNFRRVIAKDTVRVIVRHEGTREDAWPSFVE